MTNQNKRMILTQWIEYAKLSSVGPDGPTLVLTKRFELIQHFSDKQLYKEAGKIYLKLKDDSKDQIATKLDSQHLE